MRRLSILVLSALVLLGVGWRASSAIAGSRQTSDDEVIALVRQFTGRADLALRLYPLAQEHKPGIERTCLTDDGGAIFTVDLARREVLIASMPGLVPEERPSNAVDHDQALRIARSYAASRIPGFERLALVRDSLDDHGAAGGQHYMFLWAPRLGSHGAVGLQRVSVSVDAASGAVVSFMHIPSVPLAVDVEPTVSRDQAIATAQRDFGAPITTSAASLDVWWKNNDRTQPQVLRWRVMLESSEPVHSEAVGERFIPKHATYCIDAHTGEVLEAIR